MHQIGYRMFKKLLPKSEFGRHALTLVTGSTIAQAIPIAISPILTRLYTPAEYGTFSLYLSIASIFAIMGTGRYELAIMLPEDDSDAHSLARASFILTAILSSALFLIILPFRSSIAALLEAPDLENWLLFIPLSVLLTASLQTLNLLSNRHKQYRKLSYSKIAQSAASGTTHISLGLDKMGAGGLISGNILGLAVSSTLLMRNHLVQKPHFSNWKRTRELLKHYKKMPLLNLPNALLDGARLSGINILISSIFSSSVLGQYSLGWKTVQTPLAIVGTSLSQVFYQDISRRKKSELFSITVAFVLRISLIAAPLFLGIYLFSADIFTFVFGRNWTIAGEVASALSSWLFLNFVSTPLAFIYLVLNKQEIMLLISFVYAATPLSILWFWSGSNFLYVINLINTSMSVVLVGFILATLVVIRQQHGETDEL